MRTPPPSAARKLNPSILVCAITLLSTLGPTKTFAAELHDYFTKEAPIAECLKKTSTCDSTLVVEKEFVSKEALLIAPGIHLEKGTPIRAWYLGSDSEEAKALRTRGDSYANACTAAEGGCIVLFADAPLILASQNKLHGQVGRFERLNTLNFSKDTPGIVRALRSKNRLLAISVHGTLDIHGLTLRVGKGSIVDGSDRTILRADVSPTSFDEGQVTSELAINLDGKWRIKDQDVVIRGASIGSHDLGDVTLKHDGKRRWNATVRTSMHGLRPRVAGQLTLSDGAFEVLKLNDAPDAAFARTGLNLACIRGEVRPTKQGPRFDGHISLHGGEGPNNQERWRMNAKVRWDSKGLRGAARTYLNVVQGAQHSNFTAQDSKTFCRDTGTVFEAKLTWADMNLRVDMTTGWASLQGRISIPRQGGILLTHPLELRDGHIFYRGQGELRFPKHFALVGGDQVIEGQVQLELPASISEPHVALGWTKLGPTTVGLRVDLDSGQLKTFGADAERARRATLKTTPNFAPAEAEREKALLKALLVDDPQINTLRKAGRAPDSEVHLSYVDIRDLIDPEGKTVVRIDVNGLPSPGKRLQTAWEMLNAYYTTPSRYDLALSRPTSSFSQTLYEPPRVVSPYLWGTKALRLQTRADQLGLMPTAVPSTIWGAWGLRSNLGCAGHFGALGFFGSETPGEPVAGAEKRAFCWLGTRAHLGSRVDSIFDYPVGETAIGSVSTKLGNKWVKRPYKYNMMPGRSLKSCGKDRAPGALDCDPYLVEQGLSCETQQRYVGATRIGSCSPVLHEYRPLVLDAKVVQFDAPEKFGTLRMDLRDRARSEDGSLKLPAGNNPLIQCPSEVTQGALAKARSTVACTQPGQFCRAFVDVGNGGVPSLGPTFQCVTGGWQPVGLSPLEAAGFPKACQQGGSWEASIKRQGDKFIGTDEARTSVQGQCTLVGDTARFRGVGWGWWGEIPDPYCSTTSKGPKAGTAGGHTVSAALAQRAFQACSYPWNVQRATRDWTHQLAGCENPQTSLTGPDFSECKFTKPMGVPLRLVAWDKTGTLYQWEPLELRESPNDAKTPRGTSYSQAYTTHVDQMPSAGWGPAAPRVVESNQACRDDCDELGTGCLGYAMSGPTSCWLATRAAFEAGLSPTNLKKTAGTSTYLKAQPELFPKALMGDSQPCGPGLGLKSTCSNQSNHTYVLSPTNRTIGHQPAALKQRSNAAQQDFLRDIRKDAPWMVAPDDRNRSGLRVMAIANRRLTASNGHTQALGTKVQLDDSFAISLSTQPSHLTPSMSVSVTVDQKRRSLQAKVKAPSDALKETTVRFFVDTRASGYQGQSLGDVVVNEKGEATLTWKGDAIGLDHNHTHHFYALAFQRDTQGHRTTPPVMSSYALRGLKASPILSGRVALGANGKAGLCHHTVTKGQTCQSIAFLYGLTPADLRIQSSGQASCKDKELSKGTTLVFAGSCGVEVFIDRNKDGRFQPSEEPSTITDHRGRFAFADPGPAGVQQVTVKVPHGFVSREDYRASFERFQGFSLKGSTTKPREVESLEACLSLCHPVDEDAQTHRHVVRSDFKECGGVLYESDEEAHRCSLITTDETKRVLTKLKRPNRSNLYVRSKQALRSIQRLIHVKDHSAVLPRVILHRQMK